MGQRAKHATGQERLTVLTDRGYYKAEDIRECGETGVMPCVPKVLMSGAETDGWFGKQGFVYLAKQHAYRCPAGETMK